MKERLFFVGPGRVGLSLGYALWQEEAVAELTYCGRRPEPPSHPLFTQGVARYVHGLERPAEGTTAVFLAVPDDLLTELAMALAGQGRAPGEVPAFHLSGAFSAEVLAPLHRQGYRVGCLHPLQAIAHAVTGADRLRGCWYAVSGDPVATAAARRILMALGGRTLEIPATHRARYHAAAVLVSNYLPVLLASGARLLAEAGVSPDDALEALLPLARGTLDNLAELGPGGALTGPVARGDVETVDLHLRVLDSRERSLYLTLGREMLRVAGDRIPEEAREALRELFER